jgi:hypothetical protein
VASAQIILFFRNAETFKKYFLREYIFFKKNENSFGIL